MQYGSIAQVVPWTFSVLLNPHSSHFFHRLGRCVFLLCLTFLAPCWAQAQSAAADTDESVVGSISVASTRHRQGETLISEFVELSKLATATGSIAEALALEPSVSLNGQPGLFQTLSIRGLARQRVQNSLNGMRLTSERRAGVSASFIDPLLISGVEIIQGPASTYYGSGALAGVLQLLLREDASPWISTGYATDGDEGNFAAGTGTENYSAGISLRNRNNGETARGAVKNDQFTQYSGYYSRQVDVGNYQLDWQLIGSHGKNIGKDNAQFPLERSVLYPEENHVLSQVKLTGQGDWVSRLSLHYQDLVTKETRPLAQVSQVENRSLDIGFALEDRWQLGDFSGHYGLDYFGRRGVDATQVDYGFSQPRVTTVSLDDGEENETAIFATLDREFALFSAHLGGRWTHFTQNDAQTNSNSQNKGAYFATLRKPVGNWEVNLSYGTSTRFASLTERLFSGITGRGRVIGNANLQAEDSNELDIGLRYQGENVSFEIHRFTMDIDSFIERIELDETTLSFDNLVNGSIDGWQYQVSLLPEAFNKSESRWQLQFSGQGVTGKSDIGATLIDIPPSRHQIDALYKAPRWSINLAIQHRQIKKSFGATETALDSATIGALKLNIELNSRWQLQAGVENLFDEVYLASADALSTLAIGREFTLGLHYR